MIKKCKICGNTFETTGTRSICYEDHYHPCPNCGKDVLCNDPNRQTCACSRKCGAQLANASRERTMLTKYGVKNPSEIQEVRDKISNKLKVIHPKQSVQYKKCEVCGKQFELHWPYTQHTCSSICRGKYRKQLGISEAAYAKASQTNLSRYGVSNQGQRPEVHTKMEDTMEARYGVRYARYLPEVEEKVRNTCMERYGVPYYIQTEEANRSNRARVSKTNKLFGAMLTDNNIYFEFEKYLSGKFFDIALNNTVIEIDPTYSHTCAGNHWCRDGVAWSYHIEKTKIAEDNGYRCIHVFDWDDWRSILELLLPRKRLHARKCRVQKVDKKTADEFTAVHHLSGKCNGQNINYGLYYDNDELVEVMTFGKPRYNKKYDLELLRLCTRKGIEVIGGASKLFHEFCKDHEDLSIISYCDLSKFTGSVYEKIGMKLSHVTSPAKIWSKGSKKITDNLLRQRGYDQLFNANYGKGTSNEQLMLEHGWLPVYDCGQKVFTYDIKQGIK